MRDARVQMVAAGCCRQDTVLKICRRPEGYGHNYPSRRIVERLGFSLDRTVTDHKGELIY